MKEKKCKNNEGNSEEGVCKYQRRDMKIGKQGCENNRGNDEKDQFNRGNSRQKKYV